MKKLNTILLVLLLANGLAAQNLVSNGDFSVMATGSPCDLGTGFIKGQPDGWWDEATHILATGDTLLPFSETPDYYHPCSPVGIKHPSNNSRGCADPKSGTAYVGLLAWSKNHPDRSAEYIYQELATPLVKNQTYYIEFWVSAADDPEFNYFVASLGMYLTNSMLDFKNELNTRGYHYLASAVQIPNTFPANANDSYTTTNGWQRISGTYTPDVDSVKHILIGNFDPGIAAYDPILNPNSPNIQHRPGADPGDDPEDGQISYYFIDAVSITPVGQPIPDYAVISGPSIVCTSNQTYTLSNYNTLASVTWQATPASLFATSSGTGNTATLKAKNSSVSASGTLTFNIQGICDVETVTKDVWVGKPAKPTNIIVLSPGWNSQSQACPNEILELQVLDQSNSPATTNYNWSLTGATLYSGGNQNIFVRTSSIVGFYLSFGVRGQNACGTGPYYYKNGIVIDCGGGGPLLSVSPNPTDRELAIKYTDKETGLILSYDEFALSVEYVVTDSYGTVVFTKTSKKTRHKLNLSSIKKGGTYILSVYNGDGSGTEQVRFVLER